MPVLSAAPMASCRVRVRIAARRRERRPSTSSLGLRLPEINSAP